MRGKKYIYLISVIIVVTFVFLFCSWNKGRIPYEENYVEKLGFNNGYRYSSDVEKVLGKPTNIEFSEEGDKGDIFYYMTMTFDGYELRFEGDYELNRKPKNYTDYELVCARITNPNYLIGKYNIGVGSDKSLVKKAYRGKKRLTDSDVFGFIDGTYWVSFSFDDKNNVSEIVFTIGGP